MKIKEITNYLETFFPLSRAYDWDHCGLQIGDMQQTIDSMMIALTPDLLVIQECIDQDIHFLFTHHPLFFSSFNTIDLNTPEGKIIQLLIEHQITVYSLHTCMDLGDEISMNGWLMETLGLTYTKDSNELYKIAFVDCTLKELIEHIKKTFSLDYVRYVGDLNKSVHSLAILGGSGSESMEELANKVDVLITGDLKYHDAQWAMNHQFTLIDANHFLEQIMTIKTKELLQAKFDLEIFISKQKDYFNLG